MAEAVGAPLFEMCAVGKAFGATVALDAVDFAVASGEVCALVGQNGAGKSTLMAILAGALAPDRGRMRLGGDAYAPRDPLDARRAGVAMIYQELSLAPHLSVMENVLLGVEPVRRGLVQRDRMREIARRALSELGHADIPPDAVVGDLAPAAQQLVEIARALAVGCRVLVLDEPTSSLGHADVRALFDLIRRLRARGLAIVYISHFIEEVMTIADRFVVLRDGRNAGGGAVEGASAGAIVSLMVGRGLDDLYRRGARTAGDVVVTVEDVMPGSAPLELRRGEVVGIAGLLGAGRTRLLRTMFGLEPVARGRITVGVYSAPAAPHERWRQGMGMLSEDRAGEGLAAGLSIADNMTLSKLSPLGPACMVLPSKQEAAARGWVDRLGIRCSHPFQKVRELSGGNQQKVAVARMLYHDVDVLVLDEPTRGIDVASKAQIYKLIDQLVCGDGDPERVALHPAHGGQPFKGRKAVHVGQPFRARRKAVHVGRPFQGRRKAVLLVSSYLPELLGVCDRIAVMSRGRLGPARPVEEWTEHSLLMEASGARAS